MVIHRQGEQSPIVIISYLGYSPPKCTCHDKQSYSNNFMNLLECLHAQTYVSSPHRLSHTCLSQYASKNIQFSQQKFFILENLLPSFSKNIGLPSEANCWITLRNSHGPHPKRSVGRPSKAILRKIFRRNSFYKHFHFCFISCHALTPNILGCPSAYGMHDANSNKLMLIYSHAYILT